ncbi:MAG: Uma2 family endonuclease [Candidatus Eremiobacteraeota bacterium]|nr:Uma2 family endonuclease [Candidatus Eremiobacteraeota bacterium]MCW5870062.1 Uma2 family endonuclease [Candidatus Eremiobacteraeota bacterium]
MNALISPAEYLAQEIDSPIKHEYVGGVVYAMSGARNRHNRIATSVTLALGLRLRGGRCEPFNSDTKVRLRYPTHTRFYYPDAMVVCQPNPEGDVFQDQPCLVVEVLSRRTRRLDLTEKREAYLSVPSLAVYLMVEQVYEGLEAVIPLPEIEVELPLAELYERVEFAPEPE